MTKIEILKELIILVKKENYNGIYGLGTRAETSEDNKQRSKDITAFIVDLFDNVNEEDKEVELLLHILESEIKKNVYGI